MQIDYALTQNHQFLEKLINGLKGQCFSPDQPLDDCNLYDGFFPDEEGGDVDPQYANWRRCTDVQITSSKAATTNYDENEVEAFEIIADLCWDNGTVTTVWYKFDMALDSDHPEIEHCEGGEAEPA